MIISSVNRVDIYTRCRLMCIWNDIYIGLVRYVQWCFCLCYVLCCWRQLLLLLLSFHMARFDRVCTLWVWYMVCHSTILSYSYPYPYSARVHPHNVQQFTVHIRTFIFYRTYRKHSRFTHYIYYVFLFSLVYVSVCANLCILLDTIRV